MSETVVLVGVVKLNVGKKGLWKAVFVCVSISKKYASFWCSTF